MTALPTDHPATTTDLPASADPDASGFSRRAASPPPPPPAPAAPPAPAGRPGRTTAPLWATALVAAIATALTMVGVDALRTDVAPTDTAAVATERSAADDVAGSVDRGATVTDIARLVSPSVAKVDVSVGGPNGPARAGTGSAIILTEDGRLVTNAHVVDGASQVDVTLADGSSYEATVVGTDATSDLAVLQLDATGLPAATLADGLPQVGDTAVAIGSPFGLEGSVTAGIVSALDRSLSDGTSTLTGLVQTDAAINPGNSGGALVDRQGRIIGVNTAIYSPSGANDGVGFAVPATTVATVVDQLVAGGEVTWPVLGIGGQDVDPALAAAYDLPTDEGVLVAAVSDGTGAAEAGLQPGDIIVELDDAPITSMTDLTTAIRANEVGDTVDVALLRDGAPLTVSVELTAS
jgi:S1-C subfamily serine protease